ncbi:hypothetical protein HRJ34_08070 [Rhizorhabdus wittichii]|uniref:Uncharacterized protein n=1 Tax=Rhizorhabdus wittichii TaxID=160791 RepID=A0A975HFI6_9SPHN|nr:hypothetical protein [Rhizorhabdus wittichii]QTH23442.1 hypothetical protein HRJ34_08070 [Rhizorhabdus wittichii]
MQIMLWRVAHQFLAWAPPAGGTAYGVSLAIAASAAPLNQDAKAYLDSQFVFIREVATSGSLQFVSFLIVCAWLATFLWTGKKAEQSAAPPPPTIERYTSAERTAQAQPLTIELPDAQANSPNLSMMRAKAQEWHQELEAFDATWKQIKDQYDHMCRQFFDNYGKRRSFPRTREPPVPDVAAIVPHLEYTFIQDIPTPPMIVASRSPTLWPQDLGVSSYEIIYDPLANQDFEAIERGNFDRMRKWISDLWTARKMSAAQLERLESQISEMAKSA